MCGRYTDTKRDKQFLVRMGVAAASNDQLEFTPRYNVAPTQEAWVVARPGAGEPQLKRARWGLVPSWARDEKIGNSLINARSETVATKPVFRHAFRKKRCLVLADGFFEWKKLESAGRGKPAKQPYYFRLKGGGQFAMGGLWEEWQPPGGEAIESYCVVTVTPNELVAHVHDRMPLILSEEDARRWIDPETPLAELERLLKPYPAEEMESYPVGSMVSSPKNDSNLCIQRADQVFELVKKDASEVAQGELFT